MKFSLVLLFSFFTPALFAATVSSVSGLEVKATKMKVSDLDAEVSDIKLRTASGAKSKFSSSLVIYYAGGSLEKPGSDRRPNVGNSLNPPPVSATGDLSVRYRMNKNESLYFGAGFYRARPLHSREGEQLELNDPIIGYNDTFAAADIELSSGFRLYIATTEYERVIGQVGVLGYSLSTMNAMGQSRFSAGVSLRAAVAAFDKDDASLKPRQRDYSIGISPSLQYNVSERVNVYTTLNILSYEHNRASRDFKFDSKPMTQSLGVGVAVLRDFYVAPYLAFEPDNMSSDKTSVNLTAMLN
ncbi:MAG: hypothetical protein KDD38_03930, partial [Bdellovibrionales bacterium]|nr:hypothetical protein [Bdellovibrionales bacterium]